MKRITLFVLFGVAVCRLFAQQDTVASAHQFVDMGLPSGTKWATCNIGATKPEEYGWYVMWGSIEDCSNITCSKITCKTYGMELEDISGDKNFDVATAVLGSGYRMPTIKDFRELSDNSYKMWATINGVNGYLIRSKINGNSIFLPAAGYRNGNTFFQRNTMGWYWDSCYSIYKLYHSSFCVFSVGMLRPPSAADDEKAGHYSRFYAFSVRAVQ